MRCLACGIAALFILLLAGVAVGLSGLYDVSARTPHWSLTRDTIEMVRDRSIRHYSRSAPAGIAMGQMPESAGASHYDDTCRRCHGAPGAPAGTFAAGLYPAPPPLHTGEVSEQFNPSQLFWIVSNGLKMTGMPAFGENHSDDELREIAVFVTRLPRFDAARYQKITAGAGSHGHQADENASQPASGDRPHRDAHDHSAEE